MPCPEVRDSTANQPRSGVCLYRIFQYNEAEAPYAAPAICSCWPNIGDAATAQDHVLCLPPHAARYHHPHRRLAQSMPMAYYKQVTAAVRCSTAAATGIIICTGRCCGDSTHPPVLLFRAPSLVFTGWRLKQNTASGEEAEEKASKTRWARTIRPDYQQTAVRLKESR